MYISLSGHEDISRSYVSQPILMLSCLFCSDNQLIKHQPKFCLSKMIGSLTSISDLVDKQVYVFGIKNLPLNLNTSRDPIVEQMPFQMNFHFSGRNNIKDDFYCFSVQTSKQERHLLYSSYSAPKTTLRYCCPYQLITFALSRW